MLRYATVLMVLSSLALPARAEDLFLREEYTLKSPRSRPPVLGGEKDKLVYTVWIPDGVKTVRGAICNPFSKAGPPGKHWAAAGRHWEFAIVGMDYDAVKKDEFLTLKTALANFAKKSNHPELEHIPLCYTGMSRGGGMSMAMTELMPDRTIAAVPVCLEVGPSSDPARKVPVITVFGEKDGSQMQKLLTRLPLERKQGAEYAIAVQWGKGHEFFRANNLSFVFFDDVIARRLPEARPLEKPVTLKEIPLEEGWLGDIGTWSKDGKLPTIAPYKTYSGDRETACWFPSERTAKVWRAFVAGTNDVVIREPEALGDSKKGFPQLSDKSPVHVSVDVADRIKADRVEIFSGDRSVAMKNQGPWEFDVNLPAGIHGLYAVVHVGDQQRLSRPHTVVVAK